MEAFYYFQAIGPGPWDAVKVVILNLMCAFIQTEFNIIIHQ